MSAKPTVRALLFLAAACSAPRVEQTEASAGVANPIGAAGKSVWSAPVSVPSGQPAFDLHSLGSELAGPNAVARWLDVTALFRWQENVARLGLLYEDRTADHVVIGSSGHDFPRVTITDTWCVSPVLVSAGGWILERFVWGQKSDVKYLDTSRIAFGLSDSRLFWFDRDHSLFDEDQEQDEFTRRIAVVAPGNGRIVMIPFGKDGLVRILPWAFEDQLASGAPGGWPFHDRSDFAARLRSLGQALLDGSDADCNRAFSEFANSLGFRWLAGEPASPDSLHLGHGFTLDAGDVDSAGWLVRGPIGVDAHREIIRMPANRPRCVCLVADGWTESPVEEQLPGSVLLVSPGNGRLVSIEMKPHGRVLVLPQDGR